MIVWIRILDEAFNEAVITGMAVIIICCRLYIIYTEYVLEHDS